MILLENILLEISFDDFKRSLKGDQFKQIPEDEYWNMIDQINDPNTDETTKEKLKKRIYYSFFRNIPNWYFDPRIKASGNKIPIDEFLSICFEAFNRAYDRFNWENENNQFGAYVSRSIKNAVHNWALANKKERSKLTSLDAPKGSDTEGNVVTLGDKLDSETIEKQKEVYQFLDDPTFKQRVNAYMASLPPNNSSQIKKYALMKATRPEFKRVTLSELARILLNSRGNENPTPQEINNTTRTIQAQYTNIVRHILPPMIQDLI